MSQYSSAASREMLIELVLNVKQHAKRNTDQVEGKASTPWSAATCRRFGLRRLDAAFFQSSIETWLRKVATGQSADRSAHSKELTVFTN
jgi:hypothetical protein